MSHSSELSSNQMMRCAQTTNTGGPVISLETTDKPDTMAIVWMSIATPHNPIQGYRVYLNGQMCGNQVVPDKNSDRCKVVIEGCQLRSPYRIEVAAIPEGRVNKYIIIEDIMVWNFIWQIR